MVSLTLSLRACHCGVRSVSQSRSKMASPSSRRDTFVPGNFEISGSNALDLI